jgi:hypothetical protein
MSADEQNPEERGSEEQRRAAHIGSMPVARMDLRLSDEEKAALEREAKQQGLTLSDIARQSFAFYLGWLEGQRQASTKDDR